MRYESIEEPIETIVHFGGSVVRPLRFLWRGRGHRISKIRGRWVTKEGQRQQHHYAVEAEGIGGCELMFDLDLMKWRIQQVTIDD